MKTGKRRVSRYATSDPIGVCSICNYGGVELLDIIEDSGELFAVSAFNFSGGRGIITRSRIRTDREGRQFFMKCYEKYYLDEFIRP